MTRLRCHPRIPLPLAAGLAPLLALLLTTSPAKAQYDVCDLAQRMNDCFRLQPFHEQLIQVVLGTDPEYPSYDTGWAGWAVPGARTTFPVSLDNRAVVGSVRIVLLTGNGVPNVFSPVGIETTERTQGFQANWTFEGNQLEVHLASASGAVIEPGYGPIFRVVCQVRSDFEWHSWSEDTPDVIGVFGFGLSDGYGAASVVLDPSGQPIPWCGPGFLMVIPQGGGIAIFDPAAVIDTPISVIGFSPPCGQTNVNVHANITATFSEDVLPASLNGSTVTLTGGSRPVTGTVTLSGRTATLNPILPLEFGTSYTARVTQGVQDLEGNPLSTYPHSVWAFKTASAITGVDVPAPEAPSVMAARPNPFGGETTISYTLPTAARATVRVYSASGQLIRTLTDSDMPAGVHHARWDGKDTAGTRVSSGIYFLGFAASGVTKTQRLMLLR